MDKQEAKLIFAQVKENQRKLDSCPKHDFGEYPLPPKLGLKLTCKNCKGIMSITDIVHYAQGYKAANGDPNDIIQGIFKTEIPS